MAAVNLQVVFDERHVAECAKELQTRLPTDQFRLVAQLAAEIVARFETAAAGQRVLVVPAAEHQAEVAKALRLKVAGQD